MIVWDKQEMARLERALNKSLEETADWLDKSVKIAKVIPKDTGALEKSQRVEVNGDTIEVSYDVPYARRLYYHPEYNFRTDKNPNARGMWLEEFKNADVVKEYAKQLKEKI